MKNSLLFFFTLLSVICRGQDVSKNKLVKSQMKVDLKIPQPPNPVLIQRKINLVYELHLTNLSSTSLRVKKIEVLDPKDSSLISSFSDEGLHLLVSRPNVKVDSSTSVVIEPGKIGIVYFDLIVPGNKAPSALIHRLSFTAGEANPAQVFIVEGAKVQVENSSPIVLGFPVAGGIWAAIYNPLWERGHRRVIFTVNGVDRIPGRFAIDFVKLDETGHLASGDKNVSKNWYSYGQEVFAVADGVISSTRTDFPESATLSDHPGYAAELATGNYISIKIATNHYVFYEHLQPGSIQVKTGQRVKKGQIIARIGFTGQSTGPHLHLHVANADSPLGAEGLPFVFERFSVEGSYADFTTFGNVPWQSTNTIGQRKVKKERPASNNVIRFE